MHIAITEVACCSFMVNVQNWGNKAISGWEIFSVVCLNVLINSGVVLLRAPRCLTMPLKSSCRSKEECQIEV